MAQKPRVVITGLGAIAPNGLGKDAFWDGLQQGRSGVRRSRTSMPVSSHVRSLVRSPISSRHPYINHQEVKRMSRVSQFAALRRRWPRRCGS